MLGVKVHWDLTIAATLAFYLGIFVGLAFAAPPISLKVTPRQAFEPVTIRSTVTVEPNYLNTAVCLMWDSEDGQGGMDCRPLEGQYAPKTFYFENKDTRGGDYVFTAAVYQGLTWVYSVGVHVSVIPRG